MIAEFFPQPVPTSSDNLVEVNNRFKKEEIMGGPTMIIRPTALGGAAGTGRTTSPGIGGPPGSPSPAVVSGAVNPLGAQGTGPVVAAGGRPFLLLVRLFVDDSGSMQPNAEAVRKGHNKIIEDNKVRSDVRISTHYLNGSRLFGFCKPKNAVPMDPSNYDPQEGTPLYQNTPRALKELENDAAGFASQYDCHTMLYILTDGANNGPCTAQDVKIVVDRMVASGIHAVWGMGVEDGITDFHKVFLDMGIPPQCIQVLKRTEADISRGLGDVTGTSMGARTHATYVRTTSAGYTGKGAGGPSGVRGESTAQPTLIIGTSSGLATERSPEEKGEVEREGLLWEPFPNAYRGTQGRAWESAGPTPLVWRSSGTGGFYELEVTSEKGWCVLGRAQPEWKSRIEGDQINLILDHNQISVFIPLVDKRQGPSPVSRAHVMVSMSDDGKLLIMSSSQGEVTILDSSDPQKDQRILESTVATFPGPVLVRLAAGVVLRVAPKK